MIRSTWSWGVHWAALVVGGRSDPRKRHVNSAPRPPIQYIASCLSAGKKFQPSECWTDLDCDGVWSGTTSERWQEWHATDGYSTPWYLIAANLDCLFLNHWWRQMPSIPWYSYDIWHLASLCSSWGYNSCLLLNKPLDGWIRVARVISPGDADVLDAHARAILVGWDLEVS